MGYPYKSNEYVFVKQLIDEMVDLGENVTVISPQSITNYLLRNKLKKPYKTTIASQNRTYQLYSPKYLTFSKIPIFKNLSKFHYQQSIILTIKKNAIDFDFVYAHFIDGPGTTAYKIFKKHRKPYFIALGESSFSFKISRKLKNTIEKCRGFIAVSSEMKQRLISSFENIDVSKILLKPNGYNRKRFFPIAGNELRQSLGLKDSDFVVIFVGSFIHRKGPLRLSEALKKLHNPNVKAIFIGSGPQEPSYEGIVFKGLVKHEYVNTYLNAADVFVLPTLNEGSCNAIVEAMATGLAIVSSVNEFNDDLLDDSFALRIDPNSIDDIYEAINYLLENPIVLARMRENAIVKSESFILDKRAKDIIEFITNVGLHDD